MAGFDHVASAADACSYAANRIASNNWVSLGGWGGRIVAAFAEPVPNTGGYDLYVKGNQFDTSSEPGIVWVSQDTNETERPTIHGTNCGAANTTTPKRSAITKSPISAQPRRVMR